MPGPIYPPTPLGIPIGSVKVDSFSGEIKTGLLAEGNGQVFFSPALLEPNTGSQIDVDYVETTVQASDSYNPNPTKSQNNRPWLWGPPLVSPPARVFPPNLSLSNYNPIWNSWNGLPTVAPFAPLVTTQATATGVMTDTSVFPPAQTVILY